jgi:spermidine synthase
MRPCSWAGWAWATPCGLFWLPPAGKAVVAELIPAVLEWNQGPLAHLAGHPLDDPRTVVAMKDVGQVIRESERAFDAILLDVDNGPSSHTQDSNRWLYGPGGLATIKRALKPKGVLAVWSVEMDRPFEQALRNAGYRQETHRVRARGAAGGPRQVIFIGRM